MSGITFGSVGDIIAVGQIGWALAQALSSSRGSSKEYQALVKELQRFDQALMQVGQSVYTLVVILLTSWLGGCVMAELQR